MALRLALITSGFPYTAKEAFLTPELRALASAEVDLFIYPTHPSLSQLRVATGATSVRLPLASLAVLSAALSEFAARPSDVLRALRAVAWRGSWRARCKNAVVFCKAIAAARDMRRRGIEHVHAYWASTPATIAYVAALLNRIPWSFSAHRWDIYEDNLLSDKARDARFVRVISHRARTLVLERAPTAAAAKVRVLHLGVAPAQSAPAGAAARQSFTLVCAANLEPVKGHRVLIVALELLAARGVEVRCLLAGDGSQRRALAAAIDAADLGDSVTLAGAVPHEQLLRELASGSYDAAVLPSVEEPGGLHEGIPVFLMEAMAAGLPCISTNTGSIPELLDGDVGVLVEQQDPGALAAAIELLARDPDLRRELGRAARERIAERFGAERLAVELLGWIQGDVSEPIRRTMSATTLARS